LAEALPPLTRFQLELHQIMHILLANALEAMQSMEGAEIVVESITEGEGIGLRVQDNGPGLSSEAAAHLYEPFHSTRAGHLGLGLYLAKTLISRCGGEISCESSPGCTSFRLFVPPEAMQA